MFLLKSVSDATLIKLIAIFENADLLKNNNGGCSFIMVELKKGERATVGAIKNLVEFSKLRNPNEMMGFSFDYEEEIPNEMPKQVGNSFEERFFDMGGIFREYMLKDFYNSKGMYAFVSWRWVNPFVKWLGNRKCLEVMAGRGWWSHALRQKGVDVIATDDYSWSDERSWDVPLTTVLKTDAIAAVEKYGKDVDVILIGWPYMDDTAYKVIKKLHEVNSNALVVYIGEGCCGCTASDAFFEKFSEDDDDVFYSEVAPQYQSWESVHDRIMVGKFSPTK